MTENILKLLDKAIADQFMLIEAYRGENQRLEEENEQLKKKVIELSRENNLAQLM